MSEIKIPSRFTVKRSAGLRGCVSPKTGHTESVLLNETGERCCVGFLAREMGFSDADLAGGTFLSCAFHNRFAKEGSNTCDLDAHDPSELGARLGRPLSKPTVYEINDSTKIQDPERESLLTAKFAALGIAVEFVD